MFANAEHDAPETFRDTKLVPLSQHHLDFRNKVVYHMGHFTIGIIFHDNDTLRHKIPTKQ
jgi:hypothetical protein